MAHSGNYYKLKTRDWLRAKGYHVELMERQQRITIKDKKPGNFKIVWVRKDILGADLIAVNDTEAILVGSVFGKQNIARNLKKFKEYPSGGMKRWVVAWEARIRGEPEIVEVE